MIDVRVGDEQIVLVHSPRAAPADVEHRVEAGHDDAGLVAANGYPFDDVAFDVHPLPLDLGPRLAVLLLFSHCLLDRRHEARGPNRGGGGGGGRRRLPVVGRQGSAAAEVAGGASGHRPVREVEERGEVRGVEE